ncbi:hypothetical protein DU478_03230 [Thalassococcus profundi]|uniref:Uncharacterized protein n=1 Tax=Thalassococcus profundi TaxID=2282382 RepID=A0A369TQY9_9RHOB|nr:hypothetical protein DU478_03230 [Thalassococcus profundi]
MRSVVMCMPQVWTLDGVRLSMHGRVSAATGLIVAKVCYEPDADVVFPSHLHIQNGVGPTQRMIQALWRIGSTRPG